MTKRQCSDCETKPKKPRLSFDSPGNNSKLAFLTADAMGKALEYKLTRAKLDDLVVNFLIKQRPSESALKDAGLKASDIERLSCWWYDSNAGRTRKGKEIFGKDPMKG
jgi:hypothetical protein